MEVETVLPAHPNNADFDSKLREGDQASPIAADGPSFKAATKVQKVYRSYRTRRKLADTVVIAEELWWQLFDFARLNHSTVSFFTQPETESVLSRWQRVSLNASKVGFGLTHDSEGLKLAFQHWIEAIDPRHRYGHNLHIYYEEWAQSQAGQPFFYWLDCGEGRDVDLEKCPRSRLRAQCIKYLGPHEREHYEYLVTSGGKIMHKHSGDYLDTRNSGAEGGKWIFVLSTDKRLYAGLKKKGLFHHSSFLAGGATKAAGRLTAEDGVLKSVWAYSGHYKPGEENWENFLTFLQEEGVDVSSIELRASSNEDYYDDPKKVVAGLPVESEERTGTETETVSKSQPKSDETIESIKTKDQTEIDLSESEPRHGYNHDADKDQTHSLPPLEVPAKPCYQRSLSGGLKSPKTPVRQEAVLQRIESKVKANTYQLATQLSRKWSTGAGPRIGCIADYPVELRTQALEFTSLSPRYPPTPSRRFSPGFSPSSAALHANSPVGLHRLENGSS